MFRCAFGLLAMMVLLVVTAPQTFGATTCNEPAPVPKFEVGEKWTWRDERGVERIDEVIQVEGDTTQFKGDNGDVAFYDQDRILQKIHKKNGEVITKQGAGGNTAIGQRTIVFPLQIGKKWEYSYLGNASSGTSTMVTYYQRYEVVACEEVATPAGKFSSFKVRVDQSVVGSTGGTYYYWYAPDVKGSVKRQYVPSRWWSKTWDAELIKYEHK